MKWILSLALTVLACISWGQAYADGTLIYANNAKDTVYDGTRGIIYVTSGDQILRYGMDCNCMLTPIQIDGAYLLGIDLSRDDKTLAVADLRNDGNNVWVDLIDPDTLSVTRASTSMANDEAGISTVAFMADGSLVTTSESNLGSGQEPMRRLDLDSMTWSTAIPQIHDGSVTSASGNGNLLAYTDKAELNGMWGVYDSTSDDFFGQGLTGEQNLGMGINADGTQFALVTSNGTYIYDANYEHVATIGNATSRPVEVVYDPTEPLAFFFWSDSPNVRVYNMNTFQEIKSYAFYLSVAARPRISRDGLLLMGNMSGGIVCLKLLSIEPVTATSSNGRRIDITLAATNSPIRTKYGLASQPAHGQAFIKDNTLTYVPDPGFTGTDTFSYAARYHHITATAAVTVNVTGDSNSYNPLATFGTMPALQSSTPIPGSSRVPGDFNGDGTSDLLWFNPGTSQFGYWTMSTNANGTTNRTGGRTFNVSSTSYIGAAGDFNGDGYTDLIFTSSIHDMWLWTNNRSGGFSSRQIYGYPSAWQLIGSGDVNGDGKDDLLWLNPSACEFAYWLMDGSKRIGSRVVPVACGYYPTSIGYFTPSKRLSILWTSAAGDMYMWDAQANGNFRSYDFSSIYSLLGQGSADPRKRWAFGGGVAGQGIGLEWYDPSTRTGFGATLTRNFDSNGVQTGLSGSLIWNGSQSLLNPASNGYLIQSTGTSASALYVNDDGTLSTGTVGGIHGGSAPQPDGSKKWTYPDGWYVVGAPGNGAAPLPWR